MFLRSPRIAQFSRESLLKQEEALSELNMSIDDWIAKRERAENRRTRVRQKLLEHVAAALMLETEAEAEETHAEPPADVQLRGQYTPPHSPTKTTSPTPLAAPLEASTPDLMTRADVESIRIYADSDMFALLADVENEINRMGEVREQDESQYSYMKSPEIAEAIESGITLNPVAFEGLVRAPFKVSL